MKKTLLALSLASLACAASVQAETKFYGKMNVSFSVSDTDPTFSVESNASRVGLKGSENIGMTELIYQAEYQTDIDGDDTVIKQRDAYVGLAYAGMGTIKMGVMDTPLKKSQGKFDLFNDVIDMKKVLDGENRMANSLNYTTEKMGALQGSVSLIMSEDAAIDDGISASLTFKQGDIYAALAVDSKVPGKEESVQRATVIYTLGDLKIGGLINNVDKADTAGDELGFAANVSLKQGVHTFKAQFELGDKKSAGATNLSFGVDHKLAKATKAYIYVNQFDTDASDRLAVAFGLEHKF